MSLDFVNVMNVDLIDKFFFDALHQCSSYEGWSEGEIADAVVENMLFDYKRREPEQYAHIVDGREDDLHEYAQKMVRSYVDWDGTYTR